MTLKISVKEHLSNSLLYRPLAKPTYSREWKSRLLRQYNIHRRIKDSPQVKTGIIKLSVCIIAPITCLLLVFAAYFGFLPLGQWYQNILSTGILNIPPIGLMEIFIFAAVVNGLTFIIMKREILF